MFLPTDKNKPRPANRKLVRQNKFCLQAQGENSLIFISEENKENAFSNFLEAVKLTFLYNLKQKNSIDEYLEKIESFLKLAFFEFFEALSTENQKLFSNVSTCLNNWETIHNLFARYIQDRDIDSGGRPELDNTIWRVVHHIVPLFAGGANDRTNKVHLHQYEHSFIHLLRYLWKKNSIDLNAFSSALLTQEQIAARQGILSTASRSRRKAAAREQTVLNSDWQKTYGQQGVQQSRALRLGRSTSSPLQRRKNSETGKKTQYLNSRSRVSPWTWYLCEQVLIFKNQKMESTFQAIPDENSKNRTVAFIVKKIKEAFPNCSIPEEISGYSKFSEIFRFEKQTYWGWSLYCIQFFNLENEFLFQIPFLPEGKVLFDLFATFLYFIYCAPNDLTSIEIEQLKENCYQTFHSQFSFLTKTSFFILCSNIISFVEKYKQMIPYAESNKQVIARITARAKTDVL